MIARRRSRVMSWVATSGSARIGVDLWSRVFRVLAVTTRSAIPRSAMTGARPTWRRMGWVSLWVVQVTRRSRVAEVTPRMTAEVLEDSWERPVAAERSAQDRRFPMARRSTKTRLSSEVTRSVQATRTV